MSHIWVFGLSEEIMEQELRWLLPRWENHIIAAQIFKIGSICLDSYIAYVCRRRTTMKNKKAEPCWKTNLLYEFLYLKLNHRGTRGKIIQRLLRRDSWSGGRPLSCCFPVVLVFQCPGTTDKLKLCSQIHSTHEKTTTSKSAFRKVARVENAPDGLAGGLKWNAWKAQEIGTDVHVNPRP